MKGERAAWRLRGPAARMLWLILSLIAAVCTALRDAVAKHATARADSIAVSCGMAAVPAVALGAVVAFSEPTAPEPAFYTALLVSGGINVVATPLLVGALRRADLSLVGPLTTLTPLFMLVTAAVVLGEVPSPAGVAGVVIIVAGAYLLNVSDRKAGVLAPVRALARDPGARMMLLVALLYSISSTYDKVGARASEPLFWAATLYGFVALALAPVVVARAVRRRASRRRAGRGAGARDGAGAEGTGDVVRGGVLAPILLAGLFTSIAAAAQMTALLLTLASFVIAVKRTSTLFGVLLGHRFFGEQRIRERLLGAAVMLTGLVILTVL